MNKKSDGKSQHSSDELDDYSEEELGESLFKNLAWAESLPKWAPTGIPNARSVPALTRLCESPEMEMVWVSLYSWWQELQLSKGKDLSLEFAQFDFNMKAEPKIGQLVRQVVSSSLGILAISNSSREKLESDISRYAKLLRQNLREWGVPKALTQYIEPSAQYDQLLRILSEFTSHFMPDDENWDFMDDLRHDINNHEDERSRRVHQLIWDQIETQSRREIMKTHDPSNPPPTIFDVLDLFVKIKTHEQNAPIVLRGQIENKRRLLAIRLFARFISRTLERDPRPILERQVIAQFVRTMLDDPEVGEDTVKDALRNFDFTRD